MRLGNTKFGLVDVVGGRDLVPSRPTRPWSRTYATTTAYCLEPAIRSTD